MPLILVTGSTDGIGKETARQLLALGHEVVVHGRSEASVAAAARELKTAHRWACDLSSLQQIRERVTALPEALEVLVNNAGLMTSKKERSADGYELTFAVNHLAPFLLTKLLLERGGLRRIVNVASQVHQGGKLEDLNASAGYAAYSASKLANVLFTFELAKRIRPVTANCLHPGVVGTKLLRAGFGGMSGPDSLEEGAKTSVLLAAGPSVEGLSSRYYRNRREADPSPLAYDPEARERLWEMSEQMVRSAP
jgi:NAD(P)-dependent dehydrogenase (short-subunit alcohol dehydrogenase family)